MRFDSWFPSTEPVQVHDMGNRLSYERVMPWKEKKDASACERKRFQNWRIVSMSWFMAKIGRPVAEIELSDFMCKKLQFMAGRPSSSQREAFRARIILGCAEGCTNSEVAQREKTSLPTVGKWRSRFAEARLRL